MSKPRIDSKADAKTSSGRDTSAVTAGVYRSPELASYVNGNQASPSPIMSGLSRHTSLTSGVREHYSGEGSLSTTQGSIPGNKSPSTLDQVRISMPKMSLKESIKRTAPSVVSLTPEQIESIAHHSKPDRPFDFDFQIDHIIPVLSFNLTPMPEPVQPKIIKFNEQGNKTLKYGYTTITSYKFDNTPEEPEEELQKASFEKFNIKPAEVSEKQSSQIHENIDTNEDNLDNFSEAEYSMNNPKDDTVDRPEKIRKLMERQLQISKQEEKFMKKLQSIKKNLENKTQPGHEDGKQNMTIEELQKHSQILLEEARANREKSEAEMKAKQEAKKQEMAKKEEKKPDDFILKFQNYIQEEKLKEIATSPVPQDPDGSGMRSPLRLSVHGRNSKGPAGGNADPPSPSRASDMDSINFKSQISDLEPNFENVKSLNFFFNPGIMSNNFIKTDYLEYVGIARASPPPLISHRQSGGSGQDFSLTLPKNSFVQAMNVDVNDGTSAQVADLLVPKTFEPKDRASIFSEEHGSPEQAFPYNEDPPSESFDYFKQGDPNDRIDDPDQNRLDNFESFKNQKPVYSDYHHYNQGYFHRFYQNYADDINEIYQRQMYGNMADPQMEQMNNVDHPFGDEDMMDPEQAAPNGLDQLARQAVYAKLADEMPLDQRVKYFKNELLNPDLFADMPRRTESDKMNQPNVEEFEAQKYFSFTRDKF